MDKQTEYTFTFRIDGTGEIKANEKFFESMKNDPPKIVSIDIVKDAMRAAGFEGDFEKPFISCGVDKGDIDAYALALKMKVCETSHILGVDEFK
jgi:hypothetical protein